MRVAICDADTGAPEETMRALDRYLRERNREAETEVFVSAKDFLTVRASGKQYDIYLLETLQPKMDGIALGFAIRETQPDALIVYVTKSVEGANASFAISSLGYVLKPCDYDIFSATLDRACCRLPVR